MSIWPDFLQEEIRTMTSEEYHKRFCQDGWEFKRYRDGWYTIKQPYANGPFETEKEARASVFGEPTEEEIDAARERALEWHHQEIEDEHGNVYQPWVKSK